MLKKITSRMILMLLVLSMIWVGPRIHQTTSSQSLNSKQGSINQIERVHNLDTGINYTTIQEAIDAPETQSGHTIFVDAGTFYETVEVSKALSLVGEDKGTVIVDGDGSLRVLSIGSDGVSISGFTFRNAFGEPGQGGGGLVVKGVGQIQIRDIIVCTNDADWGIHLTPDSHDINITRTTIVNNSRNGLLLHGTWKINVDNNTVADNDGNGIVTMNADNNFISGNNVTTCHVGIFIDRGSNNSVFDNTVFDNYIGLSLQTSSNNTLSDNQMVNNTCNFAIYGDTLSDFSQHIDSTNTVNEKPIYYWVDKESVEVPVDAGYVALINSRNITVQNLNLTHNSNGVLLAYTTNSTVKNVTANSNFVAIYLHFSQNNTIKENTALNNTYYGIALRDSGNNLLRNNTMVDNPVNFGVLISPTITPSAFVNDVDVSNTVDGKPIYYWVNQSNRHVPSDAGCVLVVNSSNISVSDLILTNNVYGVVLISSNNSLVRNVTAQNNLVGIALGWCVDTLIEDSIATDNSYCGFVVIASLNSNLTRNRASGHNLLREEWSEGPPLGGFCIVSSNTTLIQNSTAINNSYGVVLGSSHHNGILQNSIRSNEKGMYLIDSNGNTLSGNGVTNNTIGIQLEDSNENELTWNRVANNTDGIQLQRSYTNRLLHNNITSNTNWGLDFAFSGSNTLRNNSLVENQYNFGIWGDSLSEFINDVDTSNTINGSSIIYLMNQAGLSIDASTFGEVGCLVLVNSTNITVKGLTLTNNIETLTLAYTNNSTITNITASNNIASILLWNSENNTVTTNTLTHSHFGLLLGRSKYNRVANNNITGNFQGIGLFSNSHYNTLVGNAIQNSSYGIFLNKAEENIFYHNNFVNNTNQGDIIESPNNEWDNGCEGNFWSDFAGSDSNGDGIGDTPYIIDGSNQDQYPLMNPYWNPGDINHDLEVDIFDVVSACVAYSSTPLDLNWNCHCDVAESYGVIDIFDIVTICASYGEEY